MKNNNAGSWQPQGASTPVSLELGDYLMFENALLKLELARERARSAEAVLESVKEAISRKYGISGTWKIDPGTRSLVPEGKPFATESGHAPGESSQAARVGDPANSKEDSNG